MAERELSFLQPPGPGFHRRVVTLEPGEARSLDEAWWRCALVVIERGGVRLGCGGGASATFVRGDVLPVGSLQARSLRNDGRETAMVSAVTRVSDESAPGDGSEPVDDGREEMTMTSERFEALSEALEGSLIAPEDDGYDAARRVFYGGVDRHPAAIARVASAEDVAAVIAVARESGLELAVRSGGHSVAGHSTTEGGIVLDLSGMKRIEIDPDDRTVWADGGLTAVEVVTATAEHGLAVGFGDTGSVGIGGITLGGGVGYLARKHGLTIDDLLEAELVTADGEILRVDADSHPDLFWAIRGGGGNVGVATRFRYRLHELPSVVGGMLMLPATPETILGFVELADAAPEELTTIPNVMPMPPMPFVPEEHHGELGIMALMCYAGDAESGRRVLSPFRELAEPFADLLREMPYPEIYPPDDPDYQPVAVSTTMFVDAIDRAAAEAMVERIGAEAPAFRVVQIRPLRGAVARVPNDATAYPHRDRPYMLNVAALLGPDDDRAAATAWVDGMAAAIQRGPVAAYVNFVGDEGTARVRESYPHGAWERLLDVKRRYDPTNVFRLNQNVWEEAGA